MAKFSFKAGDDFALRLSKLAARSDEIAQKALYAAAGIVADKIRDNLQAVPEEKFRNLGDDGEFNRLPKGQKRDLLDSLGVSPVLRNKDGFLTVRIGFDGYGSYPTSKYPNGIPNLLLARSVESGSSVRQKHPFMRPAVDVTKKQALAAMEKVLNDEIGKTMKG